MDRSTKKDRMQELTRLYEWICTTEIASRRRNELLLQRIAETDATAAILSRQTERLRSVVRQSSAFSGSDRSRLQELMRRERILAVEEPIEFRLFADASVPKFTISGKNSLEEDILRGKCDEKKEIATQDAKKILVSFADVGTQTAEIPHPAYESPCEQSGEDEQEVEEPLPLELEGVVEGRGFEDATPERRSVASENVERGNDEKEILLKSHLRTSSSRDSSSSEEEEYDPFFNFNFAKKPTRAITAQTQPVNGKDDAPSRETASPAHSVISGGEEEEDDDFFG